MSSSAGKVSMDDEQTPPTRSYVLELLKGMVTYMKAMDYQFEISIKASRNGEVVVEEQLSSRTEESKRMDSQSQL